jgi:hypothetical protein
MALLRVNFRPLSCLVLALALAPAWSQEETPPPEPASKPPVSLTFTPPDLDGRILLGIFNGDAKLVRTLRFDSGSSELKIDTNGYIASWDGLDEKGVVCPAGRYSARGYIVGDDILVDGEAFHFNDWLAEDKIPATAVKLCEWPDALGVELQTAEGPVFAKIRPDGALETSAKPEPDLTVPQVVPAQIKIDPPAVAWTSGRNSSIWAIFDDAGQRFVAELGPEQKSIRDLQVPKEEPQPMEILASKQEDAILLKEAAPAGLERVRMLRRSDKQEEKDGKVIADWEIVFERTLQPCAQFGVVDGKLVADAGKATLEDSLTVPLVENALQSGKTSLRLRAILTTPGSALASPEGIILIQVSTAGDWTRLAVAGDVKSSAAKLYQGNGLIVEEFSLDHLDHIAAFDAGSFLLAPAQ